MSSPSNRASRKRIAVVGAGISGLASAWLLSGEHEVTLFEAGAYLGGHTNTVDVTLDGRTHPIDTGFLVFNDKTYPNLIAMFELLGVVSVETEMSFAVSLEKPDLEWAGSSLATVFGQKRNLFRPQFWSMLSDILRFNRESTAWLAKYPGNELRLRDFLSDGDYSCAFADWYLLPMAAAIWSCPTGQMRDMPLATFIRFCQNHGLLQVFDRPMWRTVLGGGRAYVRKIANRLIANGAEIRLACPVSAVTREGDRLKVTHAAGVDTYDQVVMACHSDQAKAILGFTATDGQREVLSAIRYQPNRAILHTDRNLLPRDEKLWSAWNYFAGSGEPGEQPVGVSYLINKLQPLPFETPVVVTLNPAREPDPTKVLAEFDYAHPIFDAPAIAAQQRLAEVQGENGIWLAGAWGSYGFHEDGLKSALRVVNGLGVMAPWQVDAAVVKPELETV
ncbi:MAG: FAD-dependent oxidoreductase [Gammaproteobacteria bacterium]|nr:FAD-dependent oxidoreductase [Gammaproteobacteria bacterium]MBU1601555.1 FAD-dependent oxidoreductase [Gammaproteobacteria bacterium]MBU2433750.1 FAD-dependent oxidoreductase [Gammaproteobacteria bacterium]MBU2449712.1 FAD-dependent oxidoreductase [Gammaproteobacteria bacterium]